MKLLVLALQELLEEGVLYHPFSDQSGVVFYHPVSGETICVSLSLNDVLKSLTELLSISEKTSKEPISSLQPLVDAGFISVQSFSTC
jgi:hypothetical protein